MKNNPNKYFACSKNAGQWLFGTKLSEAGNITVLNNAVNVNEFKQDSAARDKTRNMLGARDKLVIGHVGRFNRQKNHGFLIEIFKAVYEKNPNSLLIMVGEGHLRPAIEKRVAELGLANAVKFLGVRGDISNLMQAMDVFLLPSLFEGLPVVMVEAQAAGLRCVVSDSITRESDLTGRVEFISLKDSPEMWADKLLAFPCTHVDTSELLRRNGYDTVTMADWLTEYYISHAM